MEKENEIHKSDHHFFKILLYTQSVLSKSLFTAGPTEGPVLFKLSQS